MYGPMDEYFTHQTVDPFAVVATSDMRFQDRCYYNLHSKDAELQLAFGLGNYPNAGVIDAYVVGRLGNEQFNILMSDELDKLNRHEMSVGPFRIDVREPLTKLGATLSENPYGVTFDLEFQGRAEPFMHKQIYKRIDGYEYMNQSHMTQGGTWKGNVSIDGKTFDVSGFMAARDRSWGVRGNPYGSREHPHFDKLGQRFLGNSRYVWMDLHFADRVVHAVCITALDPEEHLVMDGGVVPTAGGVESTPHFVDWQWEMIKSGDSSHPTGAHLKFRDERGGTEEFEIRNLGNVFLVPHGWSDQADDGNYRGKDFLEGFRKDLSKQEELSYFTDAPTYYRSEERRVGKECRSRWSPYH